MATEPIVRGPAAAAYADWQRGVAAVLAKAGRTDLGPQPERLLDTETYDDIVVRALYTGRDELAEAPLPGHAPFVRGRTARRDVRRGWHVCTRIDTSAGAEAVTQALEDGVSALWLAVTAPTEPAAAVEAALSGVLLDLAPVLLDAGADLSAAQRLLTLVAGATDAEVNLGRDPFPGLAVGSAAASTTAAAVDALAAAACEAPGDVRTFVVDGTVLHDAGASDGEEIAAAVAAGVDCARRLVAAGLSIDDALGQLDFRLAVTDDQFGSIAKLRAARRLWGRVGEHLGAAASAAMRTHAVTSMAMITQRDPWVNLLRGTVAAFAAGVGGADFVTVRPFDAAIEGGMPGFATGFADRMARNTQLLLLEEAHVGRVLDPAAGSWYVDARSDALAAAAWTWFQEIEAAGGYAAAMGAGTVAARVTATRAGRAEDVAHRRMPITGVSEFPQLDEVATPAAAVGADAPFAPSRYAAPFERLRDRSDAYLGAVGQRPRVFLATLGPIAAHAARARFAVNLLASGGIEAVNPGEVRDDADLQSRFRDSGTTVALLCGTDTAYGERGAAVIDAMRAAGATQVLAAGPPSAFAGGTAPDGCLAVGIDAVSALGALLTELRVP